VAAAPVEPVRPLHRLRARGSPRHRPREEPGDE
jgi:hypothetical protein